MEQQINFDPGKVAEATRIPVSQVTATVKLLDEGNTIPFITRFRKDQTEGLNENQVRHIKRETVFQRALIERKTTVIKSIESQGKLEDALRDQIVAAGTSKRVEDLYGPFRPKRQSLAATARQQGLEPLAKDLLESKASEFDLAAQALNYVRVDRGVENVDQVYEGVGHLIAEHYAENIEVREKLRDFLWRTGSLVSKKIQVVETSTEPPETSESTPDGDVTTETTTAELPPADEPDDTPPLQKVEETKAPQSEAPEFELPQSEAPEIELPQTEVPQKEGSQSEVTKLEATETESSESKPTETESSTADSLATPASENREGESSSPESAPPSNVSEPASTASDSATVQTSPGQTPAPEAKSAADATVSNNEQPASGAGVPKKKKKKKKKKKTFKPEDIFKDFFDFSESLRSIPPHRILAINRGERAKALRVRTDADMNEMQKLARKILFGDDNSTSAFLQRCVDDALTRLILPSLEREIRRELTDISEQHALKVFAKNLRNLLLQPPLRNHRVAAIDPAYRSGCRFAIVDEFGKPLETGVLHIVGNAERIEQGKKALIDAIRRHKVTAIGIGNGAACRETEKLIADLLQSDMPEDSIAYSIVNEAGASTYSTSQIGREELPDHDPNDRSAISIARRLLNPLSELVKISPENLGVGMYQHDVKAKHLHEQLAEVVESCVNFVGVDVNSASPSLLKYVAGLNQLTARRLFEHRQENGPFKNRESFKEVPGFGEVTFTQSAGFLRIHDGDEPLDVTSIHPESYDVTRRVLEKLEVDLSQLVEETGIPATARPLVPFKRKPSEESTVEEQIGESTAVTVEPNVGLELDAESKPESDSNESKAIATCSEPAKSETPQTIDSSEEQQAGTPSASLEESTDLLESASNEDSTSPDTPNPDSETDATSESTSPAKPETVEQQKITRERKEKLNALRDRIKQIDVNKLAQEFSIGQLLLRDMLNTITRPTRDPRDRLPKPVFRREFLKIEDLEEGMLLRGRVVNVVDFGAFVDIGMGESSLVHISQLSNHFIRDPHDVVAIGDLLKLWVTKVDKTRRRITLTANNPTPKPRKKPASKQRFERPSQDKDKKQRRGGKPQGKKSGKTYQVRKPKKPKPVTPITEAMKEGKEALRSFSDLSQFFNQQKDDEKK